VHVSLSATETTSTSTELLWFRGRRPSSQLARDTICPRRTVSTHGLFRSRLSLPRKPPGAHLHGVPRRRILVVIRDACRRHRGLLIRRPFKCPEQRVSSHPTAEPSACTSTRLLGIHESSAALQVRPHFPMRIPTVPLGVLGTQRA